MTGISGDTKLAGIIGHPLSHSLSPAMHAAAYEAMKLDWVYVPFDVSSEVALQPFLEAVRSMPFVGLNVTMPYKEKVLPLCDELAEFARIAGAVNTLHVVNGRIVGYNSDGRGLLESLREEADFTPAGKKVTVLGAGGAAASAVLAFALASVGEVRIVNRDVSRADRLVRRLSGDAVRADLSTWTLDDSAREAIASADLVVNATPVGMSPGDPPPIPADWLKPGQVIADMVYRPSVTRLMSEAGSRGCTVVGGLGMLVNQAAIAIETWAAGERRKPPTDLMREAAEAGLAAQD